ncbi:MAG TPA: M48 family metallopeptidase [Longimicrobiaceae bacterium]|nr:M48 family metallopeptidase [Longimicrobiaceae bacterium]
MLLLLLPLLVACVDEGREQEMGDAIAAEINMQVPLIWDRSLLAYVNRLGQQLVGVSERSDLNYRFYIVDSDAVNAFALPGGHIYLTRGLIERTENASQLSGVLAHEIGHVAARHGAQALERELRTGSVVRMLYSLFLRGEPALLEDGPLHLGTRLWHASNSRAAEREADQLAVRYLVSTGLDPRGIVHLLEGLIEEEQEHSRRMVEWFSSHPITTNRIRVLQRKIARIPDSTHEELVQDLASYPAFLRRLGAYPRLLPMGEAHE